MRKEAGLILGWVRTSKEFKKRMQTMFDYQFGLQLYPRDLLALGDPQEEAEKLIRTVQKTNLQLLENPQFPRFSERDREGPVKSGIPPLSPIYPYFLQEFSLIGISEVRNGILFFMQPFARPVQYIRALEMLCSTVSMIQATDGMDPIPNYSDPRSWLHPILPSQSPEPAYPSNNPIADFINRELPGLDTL